MAQGQLTKCGRPDVGVPGPRLPPRSWGPGNSSAAHLRRPSPVIVIDGRLVTPSSLSRSLSSCASCRVLPAGSFKPIQASDSTRVRGSPRLRARARVAVLISFLSPRIKRRCSSLTLPQRRARGDYAGDDPAGPPA
jgi:hypothetical protein